MNALTKLLVCTVLSLAAGLAYSQPAPPPAPSPRADRALKALGVTEDQAARAADVAEKARTAAKVQRAAVGVLEAQIRQAMVVSNPDLKAVNALVEQKSALLAGLEKQKLAVEVQLRQILGDQAFEQARKLLAKPDKAAKVSKLKKRPRP